MAYPAPATASELALTESDTLVNDMVAQDYSCARCVFRPPHAGGRVLVTTRKVKRGEVIGFAKPQIQAEPPCTLKEKALWEQIHQIVMPAEKDYAPNMVWSALHCFQVEDLPAAGFPLASISKELQDRICVHFVPDDTTASPKMIALHRAIGLRCTPLKLERMVKLWICNCLSHTSKDNTAVLCAGFALMNHSCLPSVSWYFQGGAVQLIAIADLQAGAELSNSYIEDCHMHKPTLLRRQHLKSWGFTCGCVRCCDPKERCRQLACPVKGCMGTVPAPAENCETCGCALSAEESAEMVSREIELKSLLDKCLLCDVDAGDPAKSAPNGMENEQEAENAPDQCCTNGKKTKALLEDDQSTTGPESESSSEESEGVTEDIVPDPFFRVDKLSQEQVDWIRETATSGCFLAPTGHWLAWSAYGFLKDLAWSEKAGLDVVLACLDHRASYVRQAYTQSSPNPPPCPEHGWELLEAAELLLDGTIWPESSSNSKRELAAKLRLEECIFALEPISGSADELVNRARKLLDELAAVDMETAGSNVARGLKRPRS